jgi:hypothetical protein
MADASLIPSNAQLASALRANGFEPVPIKPGTKQPAVSGWQHGGIEVGAWGSSNGIGVLCGPGDLVAIDVDTDDPEVLQAIASVLPPDCPRKRGSKGLTYFVRAKVKQRFQLPVALLFNNGVCAVRHVEVLTHGQQTLLPPTRHPDTGRPYEWAAGSDGITRSLYEVRVEDIPAVEGDLQTLLKRALETQTIQPEILAACRTIASTSKGARNITLNREVFALAASRAKLHQETAKKWVTEAALHAGLPESEIASTFESAAAGGARKGGARAGARQSLSFTLYRDIDPQPRKQSLVHDFLGAGEISCWFGQPGAGKSTVVIDLACHVAAGKNWFGRRVLQGGVLYVAAERADVVKRRMAAFRKHYDEQDIPLAVVGGPADLRTISEHARLIAEYAQSLEDMFGTPVRLIIIETVNRVLAGGNENDSADMGGLINTLSHVQEATGAHILTVHHTPIKGNRLRGHSSLLGACDTTILVEKLGSGYLAQIDKSNDGPSAGQISWTVESVELHKDLETGVITSAPVVVPLLHLAASAKPVTKHEAEMLKILVQAGPEGLPMKDWNAKARAEKIGEKRPATRTEARNSLKARGLIVEQNGIWRANLDATQELKYCGLE